MNLGGLLLQALLEFWPRTRINPMDEEENEVNHGEETKRTQTSTATPAEPFSSFQSSSRQDCFLVPAVNGEQENRVQKGNGYFQVPPHTPVIFGEAGGRTLFRYLFSLTTQVECKPRARARGLLCNLVLPFYICHIDLSCRIKC